MTDADGERVQLTTDEREEIRKTLGQFFESKQPKVMTRNI